MRGDFSRRPYEYVLRYLAAATQYNAVLQQQGRVPLDSDWNEQQALDQYRLHTEARDIIGACGAPAEHAGFAITPATSDGKNLQIGLGRYYLDGLLCESVAPAPGAQTIPLAQQPYLPHPPNQLQFAPYTDVAKVLRDAGKSAGIVYLDAWQRHLTALDDPLIREPALGGPDTATRVQTVWQVKILPISTPNGAAPTCDGDYPEWRTLIAGASTGLLTARTQPPSNDNGPCIIPPSAGYQRLENQLYRVEVHKGGTLDTATFKWSRENGSVVTGIESGGGTTLTVFDVGPDDTLGFGNGQWVEVADDYTELNGLPGQLVQIDTVTAATRQITLRTALAAPVDPSLHPKLRAWNQGNASATTNGVAASGGWLDLEGGIQVQFAPGTYTTGDYWVIPARTATGEIEWPPFQVPNISPAPLPPLGIAHAYCRIALVSLTGTGGVHVQDCRNIFPPLTAPAGQTKPAIHVVRTNWRNDDLFPAEIWAKEGLQIVFDQPPDMRSLKPATLIVTVEAPWPGGQSTTGQFAAVQTAVAQPMSHLEMAPSAHVEPGMAQPVTSEAVISPIMLSQSVIAQPEISIILEGSIRAIQPTIISWMPSAATVSLLQQIFQSAHGDEVRVRVRLMGHVIWATKQEQPPQPRPGVALANIFTSATQQLRSAIGAVTASAMPAAVPMVANAPMQASAYPLMTQQDQPSIQSSTGSLPRTMVPQATVAAVSREPAQPADLRYLDGQTFGVPAVRQDGKTPRIALSFPSGDGARASDFESWFYISPPESNPFTVDATMVRDLAR